jgi:hypothetical protein
MALERILDDQRLSLTKSLGHPVTMEMRDRFTCGRTRRGMNAGTALLLLLPVLLA